jgi:hypothetical protein
MILAPEFHHLLTDKKLAEMPRISSLRGILHKAGQCLPRGNALPDIEAQPDRKNFILILSACFIELSCARPKL